MHSGHMSSKVQQYISNINVLFACLPGAVVSRTRDCIETPLECRDMNFDGFYIDFNSKRKSSTHHYQHNMAQPDASRPLVWIDCEESYTSTVLQCVPDCCR